MFLTIRLSAAERKEIDNEAERQGSPPTRWARAILLAKNHHKLTIKVKLNEAELEILYRQDPAQKSKGGWQHFFVNLQELTDDATGKIELSPVTLEKIRRYAFDYNNGGWEKRLRDIFQRTLGERLDGNV